MKTETCWKCDGKGRIREFFAIDNGICYACGGKGKCAPYVNKTESPVFGPVAPMVEYRVYFVKGNEYSWFAAGDTFEKAREAAAGWDAPARQRGLRVLIAKVEAHLGRTSIKDGTVQDFRDWSKGKREAEIPLHD